MHPVSVLSERQNAIAWLFALVVALGIQVSILAAPQLSWILIGLVGVFILLNFPPYLWAVTAVLLAVFSRLLVGTGAVPQIVNFLHFPFALGGAFLAALQKNPPAESTMARQLGFGMMGLLFISLVSWFINGGLLLKPFLTWIVFAEPFLVIYILIKDQTAWRKCHFLWRIALVAIFIQLPFGFWQVISYGLGDQVQGTFVGNGSGHHIAGAVALTGALVLMGKLLFEEKGFKSVKYLVGFCLLAIIPIIADAKGVLGVFLIGTLYLLISSRGVDIRRIVGLGILGVILLYLTAQYYPPLGLIFKQDRLQEVVNRKFTALDLLKKYVEHTPHAWLIGYGPGNTFSRVALLSSGGIARVDSPVKWLELSTSQITKEALSISFTASYAPTVKSSAWQIWSSWAGVIGDVGLLGVALYGWLWWILWRQTSINTGWPYHCARSLILTTVLLGMVYSWLEEPGFILIVVLIISVCLLEGKNHARPYSS